MTILATRLMDKVASIVAGNFGVTAEDLYGPSRVKAVTTARQLAELILHDDFKASFGCVSSHFNRDQASAFRGIASMRRKLERTAKLRHDLKALREQLQSIGSEVGA